MAAFLSTFLPSSSSLLYVRLPHHKPSHCSLSLPFKPRFPSCSLLRPKPPPFSSSKTPTLLTAITKNSRTLLFILITSLLSLSGLRVHPSLASTSPPTQETQETQEQEKIQETKQEQEETDEQVNMYSEILRRDPGDVDALKCVLFIKMRRMEWDGALEYSRRLREAEPEEVEWRLMEALLCDLKEDLGEAERLFREILRERPLMVRALHGLALCMHKRLEGPAVFEMLEKALELAISEDRVPEERNIKLLIAQMHVVKGQLDVATEKLQNLINEDPRDFRPHLCQGIVYALLDKKKEADDQFEIYGSLVPDEFPDKGFIDDVILAAKMESEDRLQKDFGSGFFSSKK